MRWVRFKDADTEVYGIVEGDKVAVVTGNPFDGHKKTDKTVPLSGLKLLPPLEPKTFYAAGLNYPEHAIAAANKRGEVPTLPENADIGYRANNALIGHEANIVIPKDATDRVQYEAEVVAVIGKKAKNLTPENALDCVLGYTIGNDVSERSWQGGDRTLWRAKNTDTFKPMGPWIETDFDIKASDTFVRVNGEQTLTFKTNSMIFDIPTFLVRMSKYVTLYPGDMVWMGTEGVGPNLKHGDTVEIEITGIGTLSNPIVREGS